jgi:hypothetical protein
VSRRKSGPDALRALASAVDALLLRDDMPDAPEVESVYAAWLDAGDAVSCAAHSAAGASACPVCRMPADAVVLDRLAAAVDALLLRDDMPDAPEVESVHTAWLAALDDRAARTARKAAGRG